MNHAQLLLESRRIMSRRDTAVDLEKIVMDDALVSWFIDKQQKFKKFILPLVYRFEDRSK
jgi:hypothetical protein